MTTRYVSIQSHASTVGLLFADLPSTANNPTIPTMAAVVDVAAVRSRHVPARPGHVGTAGVLGGNCSGSVDPAARKKFKNLPFSATTGVTFFYPTLCSECRLELD
ncbi:MAG TPA: hypothetical protein VLC51_05825 [Nitrospira sp.]|nr:hypothetical protein [Nitrospira sp.]